MLPIIKCIYVLLNSWTFFSETRVRLFGGTNPSEGRLEVEHTQIWGTVCSDNFDQADAKVICSMLGYNTT